MSNFTENLPLTNSTITWNNSANDVIPDGFGPLFCFNPSGVTLDYLVTCEWRVRFDPANPAQATHTHHPAAPDRTWSNLLKNMEAEGNGVKDIVEMVADVGNAAKEFAPFAGKALRLAESMLTS